MIVEVITHLPEMEKIKNEWQCLFEENCGFSIFEHYEWIYQKYSELEDNNIILLLVFDSRHNLAGVFPFAISQISIKGIKLNALVHGSGNSADYSSFLLSNKINKKVAVKRVVDKLLQIQGNNWDIFNINRLNDRDDTARLFRTYIASKIYGKSIINDITYNINLNELYGEAKKISNIRRRFSKLLSHDNVSITIDGQYDPDIFEKFRYHHEIQFPDSGFNRDMTQKFFRNILTKKEFIKYVEISYILNNDELVAGHFGFKHNSCVYYYVPVYNNKYKQYGPGHYLILQMIDYYKEQGYSRFDFLRGGEIYKDTWANSVNTNFTIFGVPVTSSIITRFMVNLWLLKKAVPETGPL